MSYGRRRRDVLKAGLASATVGWSGCASSDRSTTTRTTSVGTTTRPATTETTETTETERETTEEEATTTEADRSVYHVAPEGKRRNAGSKQSPFGTIQRALREAEPGDEVRVAPGEYTTGFRTIRSGEPGAPITITGPASAIHRQIVVINHSHVHLRGLTIDGLTTPEKPDSPESYEVVLVHCRPPEDSDEYLEDIVCAPAGIGNSRRPLMLFERTKNLEIGPLRVTGLAGAEYVLGDDVHGHAGEVVYLGQPPSTVERDAYPWDELDQTRHVHVHHVDNSASHPHSELVNAKLGTRDVLVEYCTSTGGSQNTDPFPAAEVRFQSHDATLRWCDLRNGGGVGVHVVHHRPWLEERANPAVTPAQSGTDHAIYGNRITGFPERAIRLDVGADHQRRICGNRITGKTDADPTAACPSDTPTGHGIGHTGGRTSQ